MFEIDPTNKENEEYNGLASEALPAGDYVFIVEKLDHEIKEQNEREYLKLEAKVLGEEFKDRRVWEYLNIFNPNKKAQDIGRARVGLLSASCQVTEKMTTPVQVCAMLQGKAFRAKVSQYEEEYQGQMVKKNKIVKYYGPNQKMDSEKQDEEAKSSEVSEKDVPF